jgi:hypothetical protein
MRNRGYLEGEGHPDGREGSAPVIIKKQPAQTLPLYELKITLRGSNPANVLEITGDRIQTIYNMIVQGDRTWDYAAL